ncbi:hypothetical protein WJ968_20040 [Achromobacter xylosoxidans]
MILAVVAVVATVFTAGALMPAAVGAFGTVGGGMAAWGAGAIAGSVVSQGAGMALGMQKKFNWGPLPWRALEGLLLAGLRATSILEPSRRQPAWERLALRRQAVVQGASQSGFTMSGMFAAAGRAMMSSTITQGIALATGLQSKFSWSGVALAGVGAGVGYSVAESV